ncbi:MAG: hypothetical protein KJ906_01115 [Nanoarchaeota archaeon]|nr:hypothetical protein [Nanoarchaeota archaeon]
MVGTVKIKYSDSDSKSSVFDDISHMGHSLDLSYTISSSMGKEESINKTLENFSKILPAYIKKLQEINKKLKANELEFETKEGRTEREFGGDDGHSPGIISRSRPYLIMTIKK